MGENHLGRGWTKGQAAGEAKGELQGSCGVPRMLRRTLEGRFRPCRKPIVQKIESAADVERLTEAPPRWPTWQPGDLQL